MARLDFLPRDGRRVYVSRVAQKEAANYVTPHYHPPSSWMGREVFFKVARWQVFIRLNARCKFTSRGPASQRQLRGPTRSYGWRRALDPYIVSEIVPGAIDSLLSHSSGVLVSSRGIIKYLGQICTVAPFFFSPTPAMIWFFTRRYIREDPPPPLLLINNSSAGNATRKVEIFSGQLLPWCIRRSVCKCSESVVLGRQTANVSKIFKFNSYYFNRDFSLFTKFFYSNVNPKLFG